MMVDGNAKGDSSRVGCLVFVIHIYILIHHHASMRKIKFTLHYTIDESVTNLCEYISKTHAAFINCDGSARGAFRAQDEKHQIQI